MTFLRDVLCIVLYIFGNGQTTILLRHIKVCTMRVTPCRNSTLYQAAVSPGEMTSVLHSLSTACDGQ
jgi:hypothetical protein